MRLNNTILHKFIKKARISRGIVEGALIHLGKSNYNIVDFGTYCPVMKHRLADIPNEQIFDFAKIIEHFFAEKSTSADEELLLIQKELETLGLLGLTHKPLAGFDALKSNREWDELHSIPRIRIWEDGKMVPDKTTTAERLRQFKEKYAATNVTSIDKKGRKILN